MAKRYKVKYRRTLPKGLRTPVRKFSLPVGELVWAANFAHTCFATFFVEVMKPADVLRSMNIWNAIRSDSAQRDIFVAAVGGCPNIHVLCMAKQLVWAANTVGKLFAFRNDAVHMGTNIEGFPPRPGSRAKIVPYALTSPMARQQRLSQPHLWRIFKIATNDFFVLAQYLTVLLKILQEAPADQSETAAKATLLSLPRKPRIRSRLT